MHSMEARVKALEDKFSSIDELISLLEDVKGALRLFIKVGKVVKWAATIILGCSGITWAWKHFGTGI